MELEKSVMMASLSSSYLFLPLCQGMGCVRSIYRWAGSNKHYYAMPNWTHLSVLKWVVRALGTNRDLWHRIVDQ